MEAGIKALSVIAHEIGMCDAVCTEGDLAPELRQVVVAGDLDPAQGKVIGTPGVGAPMDLGAMTQAPASAPMPRPKPPQMQAPQDQAAVPKVTPGPIPPQMTGSLLDYIKKQYTAGGLY